MSEAIGGMAAEELRKIVERVERLEEEEKELKAQKKEVFDGAKSQGFDVPTIKKIIRLRKQEDSKRQEENQLLELYAAAIGLDL
jgi:uncharacterized protein (UPF0335 family)